MMSGETYYLRPDKYKCGKLKIPFLPLLLWHPEKRGLRTLERS